MRNILSKIKSLFQRPKLYNFNKSDYEIIYLKKLEDNKIFYNNVIYPENFFYYHKLTELFQHINEQRDFYIKKNFEEYFQKMRRLGCPLRVIEFELDNNGECKNLTMDQYKIVVDAYTYNIPYCSITDYFYDIYLNNNPFIKDLLTDWLYKNGWKSIKPVFAVFETYQYKYNIDGEAVYKDTNLNHPLIKYGFNRYSNLKFPAKNPNKTIWGNELLWLELWLYPYPLHEKILNYDVKDFIYTGTIDDPELFDSEYSPELEPTTGDVVDGEWVYESNYLKCFNEKDAKMDAEYALLLDKYPIMKTKMWDTVNDLFFERSEENQDEDVFSFKYNPLNEGARMRKEWLYYNENDKHKEFDIYCPTNTYNARYKFYNEVAWKDYPEEKKYKTESVYEFTEEEIKENYENMISTEKTSLEKWEYVFKKDKYRRYLFKFFKMVEFIDLYLLKYKSYPVKKNRWGYWKAGQDTDIWIYEENKKRIYELLNDPQYLLIMPLIDSFFEMWRSNGWYMKDKSFEEFRLGYSGDYIYTRYDTKRLIRAQKIYFLSVEYQHSQVINDCWALQDYVEYDVEFEEDEDEREVTNDGPGNDIEDLVLYVGMAIIVFIWLILITFYYTAFCANIGDISYNSNPIIYTYIMSWQEYLEYRPYIIWDFELKGPRNLLKKGIRYRRLHWRVRHFHRYFTYRYKIFRPWDWTKWANMGFDFEKDRYIKKWIKRRKLYGMLKPIPYWLNIELFLDYNDKNDKDHKDKTFLYPLMHKKLDYLGKLTGISIYDLNGKLRVRWWTRLRHFIDKTIEETVENSYTRLFNYIQDDVKLCVINEFAEQKKSTHSKEFSEAISKERMRRIRILIFFCIIFFAIFWLIISILSFILFKNV